MWCQSQSFYNLHVFIGFYIYVGITFHYLNIQDPVLFLEEPLPPPFLRWIYGLLLQMSDNILAALEVR